MQAVFWQMENTDCSRKYAMIFTEKKNTSSLEYLYCQMRKEAAWL